MSSQPTAMIGQLFRTYTKLLMWHFHTINITTCKVCSKILCQSCATFFLVLRPWTKQHWFALIYCYQASSLTSILIEFRRPSVHPSVCGLPFMAAATTLPFTPYCNKEFFAFPDFSFFCGAKSVPFLGFVAPWLAFLPHTQFFFWYNYLNRTYISTCCRV